MDVQELIDQWQASAAWHADSITPDPASLGEWMQQQLDSSGGLLMYRRSTDPYRRCVQFLEAEGVDVARALDRVEVSRDAEVSRTRVTVRAVRGLAVNVKKAERALAFEQEGLQDGCTGFSAAKVRAAAGEVTAAETELLEACGNDRTVARAARRAAG